MRFPRHLRLTCITALASISVLVGCSSLPTAPPSNGSPPGSSEPTFVRAQKVQGAMSAEASSSLQGSAPISGVTGGTLTVGRFTVVVPAGAYPDVRTVTITVPDPDVLKCDLHMSNSVGLVLPLRLVLDWSSTNVSNPDQLQILWRGSDGTSTSWHPNMTVIDDDAQTASTDLLNITDYGLTEGKAGW